MASSLTLSGYHFSAVYPLRCLEFEVGQQKRWFLQLVLTAVIQI